MELGNGPPEKPKRPRQVSEDLDKLIGSLSGAFTIKHSGTPKKGKIVLSYASSEERERIAAFLERMAQEKDQ